MKRLVILLLLATAAFADGEQEVKLGKATFRTGNSPRALEYFQQAAAKGNAEGMYLVGLMFEGNKGIDVDLSKAAQWYRQAAERGHTDAMNHLARQLRLGNGVAKDVAEALRWTRKSADGGDLFGMKNLADVLYDGVLAPKNLPEAAEWYRKAGEKGDRDSMLQYGYMLSKGEGIAADATQAFGWYLRAARAGHSSAMFNLGEYYKVGKGVAQNDAAARFWYLRAAMAGDEQAEAQFAALPSHGTAEGAALFAQAEKLRNSASTNAEFAAAKEKAFPLYLQSAELGHLPAIAWMVNAYQYGEGTEKSLEKAREWALISAEMGNDSSQTILAQMMLKGIGGPHNTQGARFWFEKAALGGNSLAMWNLATIYDGDYGLPPNEALATYWWVEAYKKGSPTAEKVLTDRGLIKPDPRAQAFIDHIEKDGPDRSSVDRFTTDVAQYCKFGGKRCHELSVAARKFERDHNAAADSANMARLWNVYSSKDANTDQKWRERSDCMKKKTESIQKHTYGEQDWYYSGACY